MKLLSLILLAAVFLSASFTARAQELIPRGTILPVQLNSSINAGKAHPGQIITGRIMQDVPLREGTRIRARSKVIGHIVAVTPASPSSPAEITLRFDTVFAGKRAIPVVANLRALANMMAVSDALTPTESPDRGTSEADWVTEQIGGDINYHGSYVTSGSTVVGQSLIGDGVLVHIRGGAGKKCGGDVDEDLLQALWVFSSDACGLFEYPNVILAHAGRDKPIGEIILRAAHGNLLIRAGSGMLLRVDRASQS